MRIVTMPQYKAEQLRGSSDTHVISIRTPGDSEAAICYQFGVVSFVAMSDTNQPEPEAVRRIVDAARLAQAKQAKNLVIHCHMGVSRSVGVARAIAAHYGASYESDWPGNEAVRSAVTRALAAQ
jgi:predicted protein tyrosine phosphatase